MGLADKWSSRPSVSHHRCRSGRSPPRWLERSFWIAWSGWLIAMGVTFVLSSWLGGSAAVDAADNA